jgi:hypothetical protein
LVERAALSRVFEYWQRRPDLGNEVEEGVRANLNGNGADVVSSHVVPP